jgi:hypothetical protein
MRMVVGSGRLEAEGGGRKAESGGDGRKAVGCKRKAER